MGDDTSRVPRAHILNGWDSTSPFIIWHFHPGFRDARAADPGIGQKDEIALVRTRGQSLPRTTEREIALLPDCDEPGVTVTVVGVATD